MGEVSEQRVRRAFAGADVAPAVAGLTYAPLPVLEAVAPGCGDVVSCLLAARDALGLDFVFAPAGTPWGRALLERTGGAGVLWVVDGPLWPVLSARGAGEGLRATVRDPASLRESLDAETERAASQLRLGASLHADALVVADDLGGGSGPLVTPAFAGAEVFPRLAALAEVACAAGTPAVLHSDGDVRAFLAAVRDAGFAAVHGGGTLDREGFERLYWAARRLDLVVAGGIGTAALDRGTYAAVRAGTRVALLAKAGGLVLADDGGITTAAQMAAFSAALAAVRGRPSPRR